MNMIGERIGKIRVEHNLSQAELAKRLYITRSSVNAWEMGVSVPSVRYLVELAKTFKTSTDYLLGLNETASINISHLNPEEKRLMLEIANKFEMLGKATEMLREHGVSL
jgi:transcriptional regulator with XRE-family HTH domain